MNYNSNNLSFHDKIIEELVYRIEEEIKEELTLDYLVKMIGYSEGHLRRIFKNVKGVSLAAYIRKRKIECAANEVTLGSKLIIDIAVDYGFSSQASFCRAFKSVVGVSPREYRS